MSVVLAVVLLAAIALQLARRWQTERRRYWDGARMRADAYARFDSSAAVVWFPFAWYPLTADEIFAIAAGHGYEFRTAHRHRGVPFLLFARIADLPSGRV
jgi:hypothetical protein